MTSENEFYKCEICGNVVRLVKTGDGTLVCCNQDMVKLEENGPEKEGNEKHVPVINVDGSKVTVAVGSVAHPMEEKHHIQSIEIFSGSKVVATKYLVPGNKPVAEWTMDDTSDLSARALCNLHGLWISAR